MYSNGKLLGKVVIPAKSDPKKQRLPISDPQSRNNAQQHLIVVCRFCIFSGFSYVRTLSELRRRRHSIPTKDALRGLQAAEPIIADVPRLPF